MPTKNQNSTRYYSEQQEKDVAKLLGGRLEVNSGAALFSAGDVYCKDASLLCECKTCVQDKDSFSIKKEWLIKNKNEANSKGLNNGCLAFNFGPGQENYFIINESLMKFLMTNLKEIYSEEN